jgi:hypothetical protein
VSIVALSVSGVTSPAAPSSGQQAPTASNAGYWVCYEFNGPPNKDYYSAVFVDTIDHFTASMKAFGKYVAATYHEPDRIPTCPAYHSEAQARAALEQRVALAKGRAVETGWTPTGIAAPAAAPPATPPAQQAAAVPAHPPVQDRHFDPNAPAPAYYGFCWEVAGDYTAYVTPVWSLDNVNKQHVSIDFHAFIQTTYGQNESAYCPADAGQAKAAGARQDQIEEFRKATPKTRTAKVVEVDWKPTTNAADAPTPRPAAAAPPPTPALDAYQQALAAQRPKGVAAALSTFCYATGSPAGGGPVHVYVTKVFSSAPAAQYGRAFQAYLRGAHHDENVGAGMCATAPDADTAQGSRQEYIASQRKNPTRAVVDVDWHGGE